MPVSVTPDSPNGSPFVPFIYATAALAAQAPGGNNSEIEEFGYASYRWDPTSVAVVDNFRVVGSAGSPAQGRRILSSSFITLLPLGGVLDDWPRVIGAANSLAGYAEVRLSKASYRADSVVALVSGACLKGSGILGTTIVSTILAVGTANAPIYGTSAYGASGVLANSPGVGVNQFQSTLNVAVGSWVLLKHTTAVGGGFQGAMYRITAKSGAVTFTYTVDRVFLIAFAIGDYVAPITTLLSNVYVSDMHLTGTGVRGYNFVGGYQCTVERMLIDGASGSIFTEGGSFDTFGLDNLGREIHLDGSNKTVGDGLLVESNERTLLDHCTSDNCVVGIYLFDSYACEVRAAQVSSCTSGISIDVDGTNTIGSSFNKIIGGTYTGCSGAGVLFGYGVGNSAHGVSVVSCLHGFDIGQGNVAVDTALVGCLATDCSGIGYYCRPESVGTRLVDCTSRNCATVGLGVYGEVSATDYESNADGVFAVYVPQSAGGPSKLRGLRIRGGTNGIYINTTIALTVTDAELSAVTAINHQPNAGSLLILERVTSGGSVTTGYLGGQGNLLREKDTDLTTAATPYNLNGTSANFGTFTLNGLAQVDVPGNFPIGATISLSLATVGAIPGLVEPYFSAAQTAGHFFIKSGTAQANDVYNWRSHF